MLKRLNEKAWFEEVFLIVLTIISLLSWKFNSTVGMISISIIAAASLILFNDFKYIIPSVLFFIFSNNVGFSPEEFPVPLIVCGSVLIVVMLIFFIRNKPNLKNIKSIRGIALLSISCFIPIFWHNIIPEDQGVFYFLYFAYFLYLFVYLFFASALNKNSFRMLVLTMGYVGILLASECALKVIELHNIDSSGNLFSYWYYLGWGLCNEAGIIMCMCLPFLFIVMIQTKNIWKILYKLILVGVIILGMMLTGSRGTLLFGCIELILLLLWTIIFSKKRLLFIICTACAGICAILGVELIIGIKDLIVDFNTAFKDFFNDTGRVEIWISALEVWRKDFVSMTFGMGQVAEIKYLNSFNGNAHVNVVYHSTIFHCMATMGNMGVGLLILHFIDKYKQILKLDKGIMGLLLIGYAMVDLYGMIDNTYGMYYYMISLMIIMASLERVNKEDIEGLF